MSDFEAAVSVRISNVETGETCLKSFKVNHLHFTSIHNPCLIAAALVGAADQLEGPRHDAGQARPP